MLVYLLFIIIAPCTLPALSVLHYAGIISLMGRVHPGATPYLIHSTTSSSSSATSSGNGGVSFLSGSVALLPSQQRHASLIRTLHRYNEMNGGFRSAQTIGGGGGATASHHTAFEGDEEALGDEETAAGSVAAGAAVVAASRVLDGGGSGAAAVGGAAEGCGGAAAGGAAPSLDASLDTLSAPPASSAEAGASGTAPGGSGSSSNNSSSALAVRNLLRGLRWDPRDVRLSARLDACATSNAHGASYTSSALPAPEGVGADCEAIGLVACALLEHVSIVNVNLDSFDGEYSGNMD